jgi:hypothetical protein
MGLDIPSGMQQENANIRSRSGRRKNSGKGRRDAFVVISIVILW